MFLDALQVRRIREALAAGVPVAHIAKRLDTTRNTVYRVRDGRHAKPLPVAHRCDGCGASILTPACLACDVRSASHI